MKIKNVFILFMIIAVFLTSCSASETENNIDNTNDNGGNIIMDLNGENKIRDITTAELVKDMGLGINLGNTFEACGDWIDKNRGITAYETAWGSPVIQEDMIAGYAKSGFKSVRIPVAWSNLMADDYTIYPELFDRVETVVNYVIDNGMYAVVNIHWDNGWFAKFPEDYDGCIKKYSSVWTQISERFKDYGDYLIFESLNEEGGWDSVWNRYSGGTNGKAESYNMLNDINQTFVNIVRASGGNNAKRHLLIAGYHTDITLTCDPLFKMPDDPENRLAVSVHYYTPSDFAIIEEDASWAKARDTWGTPQDLRELEKNMDKVKETFADKNIPVIVGEYGVAAGNKTDEMTRLYLSSVCEAIYTRGMCPMLWATPGALYDRENNNLYDPVLTEEYNRISLIER